MSSWTNLDSHLELVSFNKEVRYVHKDCADCCRMYL
jgi:hypothetical protein